MKKMMSCAFITGLLCISAQAQNTFYIDSKAEVISINTDERTLLVGVRLNPEGLISVWGLTVAGIRYLNYGAIRREADGTLIFENASPKESSHAGIQPITGFHDAIVGSYSICTVL